MQKRIFTLGLALVMALSLLAGCGAGTAEAQESSQTSGAAASEEQQEAPETAQEQQEPAEELGSTGEAAPQNTISYPLEGDYTFSIVINPNVLIASIMGDEGFTSSVAYDDMEEATGVHLDWTLYSEATWNEQFNLLMASNDWPDLFDCGVTSRYATGVSGLLEDDVVVELSGYLEEYAPDYLALLNSNQGFSESVVQQDGSVVEFATAMSSYQDKGMMIRQDWLDDLGMEAPSTIDELTEVLTAFKDAYGLTMSLMVCSGLDTGLTYAYNVDARGFSNSGLGWVVEDGTVKCTFDTDGFRGYLELLHDYYALGLFNDDFVNISYELNTVDSTYLSGACGVFYAGAEPWRNPRSRTPRIPISNSPPFRTSKSMRTTPPAVSRRFPTRASTPSPSAPSARSRRRP